MNARTFLLFRFVGVPLVGLLFNFVTYFTVPPQLIAEQRAELGFWIVDVLGAVVSAVDALLLSEGCLLIYRWLDRRLPWEQVPSKRFAVQLLAHGTYSALLTTLLYLGFGYVVVKVAISNAVRREQFGKEFLDYTFLLYQAVFDATILALLVVAIYTGMMLFQRWQSVTLEAEELKRSQLQAHIEALKAQLDPHFLFNNLNTLTTLIEEEPQTAVAFVQELSKVYRYVLQMRERDTVTLAEELAFVRSYIFLATMRFGEYLRVTIDVDATLCQTVLPPMTVQLLVENAMKHNIISQSKPLYITLSAETISADEQWLVVSNTLQRRSSVEHSTKLGLRSIVQRYTLFSSRAPVIEETAGTFVVKLPLLRHSPVGGALSATRTSLLSARENEAGLLPKAT